MFIEDAYEFTAIVLDVGSGSDCHPVVLMPTEVITFQLISEFNRSVCQIIFTLYRKRMSG